MANVKFDRKEFEKEIKLNKENQDRITMFGTPLESIDDETVEIEIFPNRPDLLSLQGYLRALKAYIGKEKGLKKYDIKNPKKDFEVNIDKSVKDVRPYTACAIVENLELDDKKIKEIIDIQEKIHKTFGRNRRKIAIGIYPLENIKLPIKYEAREPNKIKFKPLEGKREMNGRQILSRHPTGREYGDLLKGMEKFPIFIDSKNDILSMPPIINSEKTGKINENTKRIFIECSGFEFKKLKKTLNMLVTALSDIKAEVYEMKLNYPGGFKVNKEEKTPNLKPEKKKINPESINKLLGLKLNKKEMGKLLERMGYDFNKSKNEVDIPSWRTDILHEVDIAEDIAIAYGYENFEPEIPDVTTIGKEDRKEEIKNKIANILTGLNMLEVSTYHLLTKDELKKLKNKRAKIEVEDSKTEHKLLRPEILPSILKVLSDNVKSEYPQRIFEVGTCFSKNENEETKIEERDKLAIAISPGNFTEIKQIIDYIFRMLDLEYGVENTEVNKLEFIDGRTASLLFGDEKIGYFGEAHPSLLRSWSLKMPLAYLELDLEKIFEKLKS